MKAVILVAGASPGLRPFVATRPKPMIPVAGKPILEWTLRALKAAGIERFLVVVHHQRQVIERYFEHGHRLGVSIDYLEQEAPRGPGEALALCEGALDASEPFLLVYGDVLATGSPFSALLARHRHTEKQVAAVALPEDSHGFGNVYLDPQGVITRFIEKPTAEEAGNPVFAGMYLLFPRAVFRSLERNGGSMEGLLRELVNAQALCGVLWEGQWIDIIHPWDILKANHLLMSGWQRAQIDASASIASSVQIEGAVQIEAGVSIAAGAVLQGPCHLGEGCFVGHQALIRPFSAVGARSVVGYGMELKNCVLFGQTVSGRLGFIGDSVIGERVELGTGVSTVNVRPGGGNIVVPGAQGPVETQQAKLGAFVGDGAFIGAGHWIGPGAIVEAGAAHADRISIS